MCVDTIDEYWAACDRYVAQNRVKLSPIAASFSRGVEPGGNYSSCCRNVLLKLVCPPGVTRRDPRIVELQNMIGTVPKDRVVTILSRLYEKFIDRRGHEADYSGMYRENWVSVMLVEENMLLTTENRWLSRVKFAWLTLQPDEGLTWVVWLSVEPPERFISLVDIFEAIIGKEQTNALMSGFVGPFSIGQDVHETLGEARTRKPRVQFNRHTALFSLSYKHYQSNSNEKITYQDWEMVVRVAELMCRQAGLSEYCLWIDSGLDQSNGRRSILWFTKGILPYLWTPAILLRNQDSSVYASVWIELEEALSAATYNYKILPHSVAVPIKSKGQPIEWALLATLTARRILNSDKLFFSHDIAFDEIYEWSQSVLSRDGGGIINCMDAGVSWIRLREGRAPTDLEDCINIDRQMPGPLVGNPWNDRLRENLRGSRYLGKYECAPALIRAHGEESKLGGVEVLGATLQEETTYVYVGYSGVVDRIEMTGNGSGDRRVVSVKRFPEDSELSLNGLQPVQGSLLAELGW